jgi:hypothetical protein
MQKQAMYIDALVTRFGWARIVIQILFPARCLCDGGFDAIEYLRNIFVPFK